jgi:peroxiredoxin Q/BCP
LIADTSHDVLEKYGVWDQKKLFGREYMGVLRTTFVIDEKGSSKKYLPGQKIKLMQKKLLLP